MDMLTDRGRAALALARGLVLAAAFASAAVAQACGPSGDVVEPVEATGAGTEPESVEAEPGSAGEAPASDAAPGEATTETPTSDEDDAPPRRTPRPWDVPPPDPAALRADPDAFADRLLEQGVEIDLDRRTVSLRGAVLHDARSLEYPIEYLMVTEWGSTHEALFLLKVTPSLLHACLEALELEPGTPMRYVEVDPPPDPEDVEAGRASPWEVRAPTGPRLEIDVHWIDDAGVPRSVPLDAMILDLATGEPLEREGWLFVGGGTAEFRKGLERVERFVPDMEGNVVGIHLRGLGDSVVERNSLDGVEPYRYTIVADGAPERGRPVTVVLRVP